MQQYADIYLLQSHSTVIWPVPEAAVSIISIPDYGCCDTRNMQSDFAVNKYLHTVACGWIFINTI